MNHGLQLKYQLYHRLQLQLHKAVAALCMHQRAQRQEQADIVLCSPMQLVVRLSMWPTSSFFYLAPAWLFFTMQYALCSTIILPALQACYDLLEKMFLLRLILSTMRHPSFETKKKELHPFFAAALNCIYNCQ